MLLVSGHSHFCSGSFAASGYLHRTGNSVTFSCSLSDSVSLFFLLDTEFQKCRGHASSVFCCNRIPETKSLVMSRISLDSWFTRLWYPRAWGIW
jgi:hypothetical protein